jgi:NAD(P)-dependent dehydrogenase (short-subunit alcohol dehydrogenase family)
MEELRGRTAVVIGGGSGIGRGIGLHLAAEGMQVVIADIDAATAEEAAGEIVASGARALGVQVDATDREALAAVLVATQQAFGAVHLLSNNVGVVARTLLAEASESDWAWAIEFNLMSVVRAVDVFLSALREHGEPAHIVNTASMAALVVHPAQTQIGLYTTTKHALLGYGTTLRDELAASGIGVSTLCPGLVASNIAATTARNRPERYGGAMPAPQQPSGMASPRTISPDEVGRLVVRAVRADRCQILTHTDSLALIARRQAELLDDVAFLLAGLSAP